MEVEGADFTRPLTRPVEVTLPGFRGRTTINPEDTEQRNTRRKKQSESETTCTENCVCTVRKDTIYCFVSPTNCLLRISGDSEQMQWTREAVMMYYKTKQ